jgi:2-iminobutanoate/2-iminopropanoate deaminase
LLLAATITALTATESANAASPAPPVFHSRPGSKLPFSQAVRAGDWVFASGQIGVRDDGSVPPDMAEQARLAMDHTAAALAMAGASLDDVVKCTVMLGDMRQWAAFNTVYASYFKPGRMPARSSFGASGLAFGAGVEVECLAYQPAASGAEQRP